MADEFDLSEGLSNLLGDPETLSKIISAVQLLAPSIAQNSREDIAREENARERIAREDFARDETAREDAKANASSSAASVDPRCALLLAVKPFLRPSRQGRADAIIRALHIAALAGQFLR